VQGYFKALRFPEGWGSQISRWSAHEGCKVVSRKHRPPVTPRKYSWYSFPQRLIRPQGHSAAGRMSMKNFDYTVRNRIRDLPATTCPVCLYNDSCKNILKFGTPYVEHSVCHFTGIFTSATRYSVTSPRANHAILIDENIWPDLQFSSYTLRIRL
jgi:hypothetical protein